MQIIKRGILPEHRVYRATCRRCETEVEFQECEGKVSHCQRDGSFVSVDCPVCSAVITKNIDKKFTVNLYAPYGQPL